MTISQATRTTISPLVKCSVADIVRVATIIEAVEAKQRIPPEVTVKITYYGKKDVWVYHSVYRANRCQDCEDFQEKEVFSGTEVRITFPFHVIQDADMIKVNVHPNCRCYLTRLFPIIGKKLK